MALAGTKSGTAPTLPVDEVLPAAPPPSKLSSFWQTLKPFGWQGLPAGCRTWSSYASVLNLLVYQWYNDADYSHGFIVPILSAYLIWARRDKLRQIVRRPSPSGMLVVLGSLGLLFVGSLGAELFLSRSRCSAPSAASSCTSPAGRCCGP